MQPSTSASTPPSSSTSPPTTHPVVSLKRLEADLPAPSRIRAGDAAADLPARADTVIPALGRALVPTGFAVAIPEGWAGLILPRSGLALKSGITVLNTPGLIDSGYRGELQVILHNTTDEDLTVTCGQRIAQLLIVAAPPTSYVEVDELPPAPDDRGTQGFGSSGV
ncbi:MAG: dUTP diphosphatase [Actinomycetota bacterium]